MSEEAALEEDRRRSFDEHMAWLARRPRWALWGGVRQATDLKKRRDMEETSRYLGESRDV